ncbi:hypothetical protein SDJN03_29030, partial [Cucurbita argyrosperma subsp. sororia]
MDDYFSSIFSPNSHLYPSSLLFMEKNAGADGVDPPLEDSSAGAQQQEQSGWTDYLVDYSSPENAVCSSTGSCSWDPNSVGKAVFEDDDDALEDTATSPIHSTKVST